MTLLTDTQTKTCTKCLVELPLEMFYARRDRSGFQSQCKSCQLKYNRDRHAHVGRVYDPDSRFRTKLKGYGLTEMEYYELLAEQEELCAICRNPDVKGELHIDHNHETGKVRGLLCGHCNKALGLLLDSPDRALGAYFYLRKHDGR